MEYNNGICGGTFDHLHKGHKEFLKFAFSKAKHVYITITSDIYTAQFKPQAALFEKRKRTVEAFLQKENLLHRATILSIDDVYGISLSKIPFDALFVTPETEKSAEAVNKKRQENGLSPLHVVVFPFFTTSIGIRLSSSFVRSGIFSSKGKLLIKNDFLTTPAFMPDELRAKLKMPFGEFVNPEFFKNIPEKKIITVGDITTQELHTQGIKQHISVIDFTVERKKQQPSLQKIGFTGEEKVFTAINPHSTITPSLWMSLEKALETQEISVVVVEGEEDLAVIPILILAPFGYSICYGQPHQGMVCVEVTEETKQKAVDLLQKFVKDTTRGH